MSSKVHGLNEGKLRMQEDRLAQYGLLNKLGSSTLAPNTRHGNVPIDTDSKGRIDLGLVQVNAANLGERKAPPAAQNAAQHASTPEIAASRNNPYQDNSSINMHHSRS